MGAALSAVREEVKKGAESGYEDVLSVLETLHELADTKAKLFYANLITEDKIKEYHISKVQNLVLRTFVSVEDKSKIPDEVGKTVGSMMDGEWLKGFTGLFSSVLSAVIGEGKGSQSDNKAFYVFVSGLGINRLDYYIYTRDVELKAISSKNTKVVVIGYALSSIIAKEMSQSDLHQILSKKKFYGDDKKEITDEKELFDRYQKYAKQIADANGIKLESLNLPQLLSYIGK